MRRGGKGEENPNRKAETNQNSTDDRDGDDNNEDALRRTAATWTATEEGSYSARATASPCEVSIEQRKCQKALSAEPRKTRKSEGGARGREGPRGGRTNRRRRGGPRGGRSNHRTNRRHRRSRPAGETEDARTVTFRGTAEENKTEQKNEGRN
jgi:hypothetical protein